MGDNNPELRDRATREMGAYFATEVADRRANPTDDLIGHLVTAEVDGQPIDDPTLVRILSLILVAGVSLGGMIALSLYSFLIIGGKAGLVHIAERRGAKRILEWFEVLSMALLAAFGIVLLIGIL